MEIAYILAALVGVFLGCIASLIAHLYFEKAQRQKAKIEDLILNGSKYYALSSEFSKEENLGKLDFSPKNLIFSLFEHFSSGFYEKTYKQCFFNVENYSDI